MYGDLSLLEIPRTLKEKLATRGLTSLEILHNSLGDIVKLLKLSHEPAVELATQVAKAVLRLSRDLPVLSPSCKISTRRPDLDAMLGGGFSTGSLHEIAGGSGSGKSSICLNLLISVQCPLSCQGFDATALYIDTEGSFSSSRYMQLLSEHIQERHRDKPPEDYLRSVRYTRPTSEYQFMQLIDEIEVHLKPDTKLIVIDDIGSVLKPMQSKDNLARSKYLVRLGLKLQQLAADRDLAVVVTNKLTQVDDVSKPRFGESWTSVLTSRLMI